MTHALRLGIFHDETGCRIDARHGWRLVAMGIALVERTGTDTAALERAALADLRREMRARNWVPCYAG